MKLTKRNVKKIIMNTFDIDIDTFLFTDEDGEINVKSKFESINVIIKKDNLRWKDELITHIKWQLGI